MKKLTGGKLPQNKKAVFLSPHSDDVALSLGAFLMWKPSDVHIHIVTVFSISECTADNSITNSAIVSSIRKLEDEELIKSLSGDVKGRWLDRQDAPLRLHISDETVFHSKFTKLDMKEVQHLVSTIKVEYDGFDLIFAPIGLGTHIDHLVVRNAALELLRDGFPIVFYEDIPYAADLSLKEITEHIKELESLSGQQLDYYCIKTGISVEEKVSLLSCYRSQIDSRTESRVRSHANRIDSKTVVERVWASPNSLPSIKYILKGGKRI